MIIRDSQMAALAEDLRSRFEEEMVARFLTRARELLIDEPDLRSMIRGGVQRAEAYGVVEEADVRRYLEYVLEYGEGFDLSDWASPILSNPAWSGSHKMDRIDDYATFVLRNEGR